MVAFGGSSQNLWNLDFFDGSELQNDLTISHEFLWYGALRFSLLSCCYQFDAESRLQLLGGATASRKSEMQTTAKGTNIGEYMRIQGLSVYHRKSESKSHLTTWQRSMAKQQWQQSAEPSAGLWLLGKCHSQRWVGLVGEWPAAQASVRCLKLGAIPAVCLTHLLTGKCSNGSVSTGYMALFNPHSMYIYLYYYY